MLWRPCGEWVRVRERERVLKVYQDLWYIRIMKISLIKVLSGRYPCSFINKRCRLGHVVCRWDASPRRCQHTKKNTHTRRKDARRGHYLGATSPRIIVWKEIRFDDSYVVWKGRSSASPFSRTAATCLRNEYTCANRFFEYFWTEVCFRISYFVFVRATDTCWYVSASSGVTTVALFGTRLISWEID